MSRAQGSVRIGPISLFTLVIVLCLAVMAALSVTTAQATYSSAEKQALFITDTYKNEAAAQAFVAEVDTALAAARKQAADDGQDTTDSQVDNGSQNMAEDQVDQSSQDVADEQAGQEAQGEQVTDDNQDGTDEQVDNGSQNMAEDQAGQDTQVEQVTDDGQNAIEGQADNGSQDTTGEQVGQSGQNSGLEAALLAVDQILPAGAERDGMTVRATFTTESGRTLSVELTIHADATYEITSWKATTQWTDSGGGETLWSGPAQTR